jgi:hypothetical protein
LQQLSKNAGKLSKKGWNLLCMDRLSLGEKSACRRDMDDDGQRVRFCGLTFEPLFDIFISGL